MQGFGTTGCRAYRDAKCSSFNATVFFGAALLAVVALAAALFPSRAIARNQYNPGWSYFGDSVFGYSERRYRPRRRQRPQRSRPNSKRQKPAVTHAEFKDDGRPLFLMVSLNKQRVYVYDAEEQIAEAPISSGARGHPTPTGIFSILQKRRRHYSNLYDSAPMPNMQRLTWSGVAMHAGHLPGYPASHGCVRLPHSFSKKLFSMTEMGTRVVVTKDPVAPEAFIHSKLVRSYPPDMKDTVAQSAANDRGRRDTGQIQTASVENTNANALTGNIGITADDATALAAAPQYSPYRAKRIAERAEVEAAIEKAKADKDKHLEAAKTAVADIKDARKALVEAKREARKLKKAVEDAKDDRAKANKALKAYFKEFAGTSPLSAEERGAAIEKEKALEAEALALTDAVDAAKVAAKDGETAVEEVEAKLETLEKTRKASIDALGEAKVSLRKAGAKLANIKEAEKLRNRPVSVFISRKTGKLYVRQKYTPIFETDVTIQDSDKPLGTHLYTALDYANDGKTELQWNAISIPGKSSSEKKSTKKKKKADKEKDVPAPVPAVRQTAKAAWDRIEVSKDARERIQDLMKPGSSVIITDLGISNETGKYTDFIVLTRN